MLRLEIIFITKIVDADSDAKHDSLRGKRQKNSELEWRHRRWQGLQSGTVSFLLNVFIAFSVSWSASNSFPRMSSRSSRAASRFRLAADRPVHLPGRRGRHRRLLASRWLFFSRQLRPSAAKRIRQLRTRHAQYHRRLFEHWNAPSDCQFRPSLLGIHWRRARRRDFCKCAENKRSGHAAGRIDLQCRWKLPIWRNSEHGTKHASYKLLAVWCRHGLHQIRAHKSRHGKALRSVQIYRHG